MIDVPYNCKICGVARIAQADDETPPVWLTKLKKLLTCDPCYRYHNKRRRAHDWISNKAIEVSNIRAVHHEADEDKLTFMTEPARLSIVAGTKRFAQVVCRHHNHIYRWEPSLVDQIMEQPEKCRKILFHYERLIKTGQFR